VQPQSGQSGTLKFWIFFYRLSDSFLFLSIYKMQVQRVTVTQAMIDHAPEVSAAFCKKHRAVMTLVDPADKWWALSAFHLAITGVKGLFTDKQDKALTSSNKMKIFLKSLDCNLELYRKGPNQFDKVCYYFAYSLSS
jgi:hypothetical protein